MPDFMKEARKVQEEVVRWRRHIHANPETGLHLPETTAYVMEELRKLGYEPKEICDSGITAVLEGGKPGKCIMLRADMDALPIPEDSGEPFSSKREGVSHACGHDAHTAMLLEAGKAGNAIPDTGIMCGSIRTYSREVREYVKRRLREIAEKTAESLRGKAVVEFPAEMAGLYNDPEIGAEMWPYAKEAVGAENCAEQPSIMASEDFAFILEKCPGVYMRVSLGDQEEGYTGIPHNAKFRINEDGMPYGVAVYCNCAYRWLRSHGE